MEDLKSRRRLGLRDETTRMPDQEGGVSGSMQGRVGVRHPKDLGVGEEGLAVGACLMGLIHGREGWCFGVTRRLETGWWLFANPGCWPTDSDHLTSCATPLE
jgi:hypothetical protein